MCVLGGRGLGLGPWGKEGEMKERRGQMSPCCTLLQLNLAFAPFYPFVFPCLHQKISFSLKLSIIRPFVPLVSSSHCNPSQIITIIFQSTVYKAQVLSFSICSLFWRQIRKSRSLCGHENSPCGFPLIYLITWKTTILL